MEVECECKMMFGTPLKPVNHIAACLAMISMMYANMLSIIGLPRYISSHST
jgi:hypothetical protein